ncbi:MAG: exopolyphosphatase [Limosilactobacillus sp.]|uniref:exopolyphosphatase n=1 Tax=Limosilactobacillus sp. TaxID=2773925 RepID=UPI0026FCE031|nr:exopolyphosphatase [Limosilactobacillus sp.]
MNKSITAVIFLEPDQVCLRILELPSQKVLDDVHSSPLMVGTDKIANYAENMPAIVNNIAGFKQLTKDYQVDKIAFYGALEDLDSVTAQYVADQLEVRTDLKIKWLNNSQLMAQTTSCVVTKLDRFAELSKHCLYLVSLGLNTMTLAFFHHGNFETLWELDLGSERISQLVERLRQTTTNPQEIIQDYINSKFGYIAPELTQKKKTVLLVQNAQTIGRRFIKQGERLAEVPTDFFKQKFTMESLQNRASEIWSDTPIEDRHRAWLAPNYLVVSRAQELINPMNVFVTNISVMDGLTNGIAVRNEQSQKQIDDMIRTSADDLAQRYGIDTKHMEFVSKLALQLFDQLQPIHRLGDHERLLLEIATKVDDIGNFINQRGHYRHSAYILRANPMIGLSDEDNRIIAEVARYHSTESPTAMQAHYRHLDDDIQLTIAKLAAILRVVDALDDSRQQKIKKIDLKLTDDGKLKIRATATDDLVLEKWSFGLKASLFKDVYGIEPILVERGD